MSENLKLVLIRAKINLSITVGFSVFLAYPVDSFISLRQVSDFYRGILSNDFFSQSMHYPIRSVFDHYFSEQKRKVFRVLNSILEVYFDCYSHRRRGNHILWRSLLFFSIWDNSIVLHRGKLLS